MVISRSERFNVLEQELNSLRANFLPENFDPAGDYNSKEIALATAYLVLAHAEIETYLEDRALEIGNNALALWSSERKTTITLLYLFAFTKISMPSRQEERLNSLPDNTKDNEESKIIGEMLKDDFDQKLGKAFGSFKKRIEENHGVRKRNILSLLLPIGINSNEIDVNWLDEIDNFAKKRGDFAHQSASRYTTIHPPNPKDELKLINRLVHGFAHINYQTQNHDNRLPCLIDIDQLLNNLLNS
jgi:hypothetical protein